MFEHSHVTVSPAQQKPFLDVIQRCRDVLCATELVLGLSGFISICYLF